MDCPCGSNLNYQDCCGCFHGGKALAPTAEQLMRSRYSAYVLKLEQYLLDTWHPSKRPKQLDLSNDQTQWLSLKIIDTDKGQQDDQEGSVEFIAEFEVDGIRSQLHELSKFVKKHGAWLYRDGVIR